MVISFKLNDTPYYLWKIYLNLKICAEIRKMPFFTLYKKGINYYDQIDKLALKSVYIQTNIYI